MPIPVGAIIGGATALTGALDLGGNRRRRKQVEQQEKLNDVNAKTSKELADYEQGLKMKMWQDTNYGAQLEQADKAGVSKAAALGGSGTGTQGASVGGVSGGGGAEAPSSTLQANSGRIMAGIQMAQLELLNAQKENIEADTQNKEAGAGKATAETEGQTISNKVQRATIDDQQKRIIAEAEKARNEAGIAHNENIVQTATQQDKIKGLRAEYIGKALENELTKAKTNVNKEEAIAIAKKLIQQDRALDIQEFSTEMEKAYPGIDKVFGRTFNDTIQAIFDLFGSNRDKQKKTIKNN